MREQMPDTPAEACRGPRIRTTVDRAFEDPTPSLQRLADLDPGRNAPKHAATPEAVAWLRADRAARRQDEARRRLYGQ
jgi:hypothetical protein